MVEEEQIIEETTEEIYKKKKQKNFNDEDQNLYICLCWSLNIDASYTSCVNLYCKT